MTQAIGEKPRRLPGLFFGTTPNVRASALFSEVHEELTSVLERFQIEAAIKNGIAADQLVLIAIAMNHGLVMHHLMDPRHYPDHLVTASSDLVFDKLMGFTGK